MKCRFSKLSSQQLTIVEYMFSTLVQMQLAHKEWVYALDKHILGDELLSRLTGIIDWEVSILSISHHTGNIIFLCSPVGRETISRFVLKIQAVKQGSRCSLEEEALFYQLHQNTHLPELLGFFVYEGLVAIALGYLEGCERFSTLLWKKDFDKNEAYSLLESILVYLLNDLFYSSTLEIIEGSASWSTFEWFFIERATSRLSIAKLSGLFSNIVRLSEIEINNVLILGPLKMLSKIRAENRDIHGVWPSELGNIHGDPHLGNILIPRHEGLLTREEKGGGQFFLLDPRFSKPGPFVYDLAKIYQSFIGHYEAILRGAYKLETSSQAQFSLSFVEPRHYLSYGKIFDNLVQNVHNDSCAPNHDAYSFYWTIVLSTGIHLISAAPYHIVHEKEAIVMLLWGSFLMFNAYQHLV